MKTARGSVAGESHPLGAMTAAGAVRCNRPIEYQDRLRMLALNDDRFVESVLGMGADTLAESHLDARTHALVRLGALLAIDAAPSSYHAAVQSALAAGATVDEIVGILIAV